jgi:DNA-binding IclR family transcriptional regulator
MAGRIEAGSVKVLAFCEGSYSLRYTAVPGNRLGVHASAIGKAILMQRTPAEAERVFGLKPRRALATRTLTEIKDLLSQLEVFRGMGYAYVENEGGDDLAAIAIAKEVDGAQVGVSLIGPVTRLRVNHDAYLSALRRAMQALRSS